MEKTKNNEEICYELFSEIDYLDNKLNQLAEQKKTPVYERARIFKNKTYKLALYTMRNFIIDQSYRLVYEREYNQTNKNIMESKESIFDFNRLYNLRNEVVLDSIDNNCFEIKQLKRK